jgi:hypothetical protein
MAGCQEVGILVVMITGNHAVNALAIAPDSVGQIEMSNRLVYKKIKLTSFDD